MAISEDNKILKAAIICLNINASEIEKLIEKKNEFCKDDNFGLSWVLSQVIKTSQPSLLGTTEEEEILVRQWLEYASTHLSHLDDMSLNDTFSTFKELNEVLSDRVFLAGNKLTLADLIFYYMVYISFRKLSLTDKEKYIHLSRWFDHIQQNRRIRQSNTQLVFSRNILFT